MNAITIISIILAPIFVVCCENNNSNKNEESKTVEIGSFNYALGVFKVKFKKHDYLMLINENDYYYLLENLGKVRGKIDYFNNRKKIIGESVELDSALFSNLKNDIIFVDSCDKKIINQWVEKIKNNPQSINKILKKDSSLNVNDLNNIYYGLVKDSFKIYKDDVTGGYILEK